MRVRSCARVGRTCRRDLRPPGGLGLGRTRPPAEGLGRRGHLQTEALMLGVRPRGRTVPLAVKVGAILRPPGGLGRSPRSPPRRAAPRPAFEGPADVHRGRPRSCQLAGPGPRRAPNVVRIVGTARAMPHLTTSLGGGGLPYSNSMRFHPTGGGPEDDKEGTSTTNRILGDLDVRDPRGSARARASVRRWPWSSRRGRSGDNRPLYALNWTRLSCHRFVANRVRCLCSS